MSLNKTRMRVLIAGAGPTGLTAAVELARRGITPDVIDRKEDPSTLSRAVGIMPSSLKTLAPSGVTERLLAEGIKIRELQVFSGTLARITFTRKLLPFRVFATLAGIGRAFNPPRAFFCRVGTL